MFGDSTTVADVRQILAKQAAAAESNEASLSVLGLEHLETTLLNSLRYLVNMSRDSTPADERGYEDVEAGLVTPEGRGDGERECLNREEELVREIEGVPSSSGECRSGEQEETELHLMELPVQVLLHIFSFLDAPDVASVGGTCRQCYSLCADQILWRDALEKDKLRWRQVGHRSNPALYEAVNSDLTYKEIYMRCSPDFQRESSGFNLMRLPQLLWSFIPHKPPKVVMFGPGLESNSTTLVRKFLGSGTDIFKVLGVFPALLPGVGTGFRVSVNNKLDMRLITLYSGTKRDRENPELGATRAQRNKLLLQASPGGSPQGGEAGGRGDDDDAAYEPTSTIKELCRNVEAFIFVVDAMVGLETLAINSQPELFALMNDRWTSQKCPLVILSCVPNTETARVPCVTMAKELALHKLNRAWKMFDVDVSDLSGVVEAVTWLVESAQGR